MKEVDQHNSLKAKDRLGTDEMNELKKELKELKTSFKRNNFSLKCNALLSRPQPPLRRTKRTRDRTVTLYLLFQLLVGPSLITESKYHKKDTK